MSALLGLVLLASLAGMIRPYVKGASRWHFAAASFATIIIIGATAPKPQAEAVKADKPLQAPTRHTRSSIRLPDHPWLTVEPVALDAHRVQFTIGTNMPTPIRVAAAVALHGQKDDDVYIGYDEFVTLTGPNTVLVLDTSKATSPLPAAKYDATVNFYPRWGAKENPAAVGAPRLTAAKEFLLTGSGEDAAAVALKAERHRWVMKNIYMDMPWSEARFEKRLGRSIKGRSETPSLYDAFFFPGADTTLLGRIDIQDSQEG